MGFTENLKAGVEPYREKIAEVRRYLISYFKNPVHAMRSVPQWEWSVIIIFFNVCAAICGLLSGLVSMHLTLAVTRFIVLPISTTINTFIFSGFLYYTFLFIFKREIHFKTLFTIVVFSLLPFLSLFIFSEYVPAINTVGLLMSSILLIVGLTENSTATRKNIIKLVGSLYLLYIAFWIYHSISLKRDTERFKFEATPQSIEKLKKELND